MKLLDLILQVVEFNCVFGMPTQTIEMWIYCKTFRGARRETKRNGCRYSKSALRIKTTDAFRTPAFTQAAVLLISITVQEYLSLYRVGSLV